MLCLSGNNNFSSQIRHNVKVGRNISILKVLGGYIWRKEKRVVPDEAKNKNSFSEMSVSFSHALSRVDDN